MDAQATAAPIAQAAEAVQEAAQDMKRANAAQRRSARELLQRMDALERACAEHGIRINLNTQTPGGHGVRRDDNAR